jgi:flagellar biosynthesis GTPase FlhF
LYEESTAPTASARLVLAYRDGERLPLSEGGEQFPAPHLLPQGMLNPAKRYTLIVAPLYIQTTQIGFILLEPHTYRENYEILRTILSANLYSALLVQEQRKTQTALEQAYQHVATEKERAEAARRVAEEEKARAEQALEDAKAEKGRAEAALEQAKLARFEAEQSQKDIAVEKARAEAVNKTLETQIWRTEGLAQLNNVMRGEQNINTLADKVMEQLCTYIDLLTGVLYIQDEDTLRLAGGIPIRVTLPRRKSPLMRGC